MTDSELTAWAKARGATIGPSLGETIAAMEAATPQAKSFWPDELPATISEGEFQAKVIEFAKAHGWLHYHTYDSRKSVAGFPDLVLVRGEVIWAELKDEKRKVSDEQKEWLEALRVAGQKAYVWRPRDWQNVKDRLK
jgi:hypothetical protein